MLLVTTGFVSLVTTESEDGFSGRNDAVVGVFHLQAAAANGGIVVNDLQTALGKSYRVWAKQCREMAKHTARPAALLMRAQVFEASAAAVETAEHSDKDARAEAE